MLFNNERIVSFLPSAAQAIGLEEAILLQALSDGAQTYDCDWVFINKDTIRNWLPFWSDGAIKRILKNLVDIGAIHFNSPPFGQSEKLFYSFSDTEPGSSKKSNTHKALKEASQIHKNTIPSNWVPDNEIYELLKRNLNVSKQFADEQITGFIGYHISKGTLASNWSNPFIKWVNNEKNKSQTTGAKIFSCDANKKIQIDSSWRPSDEAIDLLAKHAGIESEFIEFCIAEFILYWSEKGEASDIWSTRFIAWVRRQWARYESGLDNTANPYPMTRDWMPSKDVYAILNMSEIDKSFTDEILPEFRLYWSDNGQANTNWNSRFLNHVKTLWSKRLKPATQREYMASTTLLERISDDSWAK